MYQPPHFREDRPEMLHGLIRAHPLGLLISHDAEAGVIANPLPFMVEVVGNQAVLHAHMAKGNPQAQLAAESDVLVVFQGPAHYVSPSWYATKQQTHKVVPTWNYAIVQARGTLRVTDDPAALHALVSRLTDMKEETRADRWAVTDAPEKFIDSQLKGILGLSITLTSLEGKWKVSQNRPEQDRAGVADGLRAEGTADAHAMAALGEGR